MLESALSSNGVLGLTYFTANYHQRMLFSLLSERNKAAHPPFSTQPEHTIITYLRTHSLEFLKDDPQFMDFFGARAHDFVYLFRRDYYDNIEVGSPITELQLINFIESSNLEIKSWFPTAYSHPFG